MSLSNNFYKNMLCSLVYKLGAQFTKPVCFYDWNRDLEKIIALHIRLTGSEAQDIQQYYSNNKQDYLF